MTNVLLVPVQKATYTRLLQLEAQLRLETRVVYADAVAEVVAAYRKAEAAATGEPCTPSP